MRKIKNYILLILLSILFAGALLFPQSVFAETEEEYPPVPDVGTMGMVVNVGQESDGLKDSMLATRLLRIYNAYYGLKYDRETVLRSNMFIGMDFTKFDGVLDLSNGLITTLDGLELFNFDGCNITEINLSGNKIESIEDEDLSTLDFVKSLNLSKNRISIFMVDSLVNLNNLNLSDNLLSDVNLTFLRTETSEVVVDLSGNKITNIEDVSFNREAMLIHNKIHLYLINSLSVSEYPGNSQIELYTGIVGSKTSGKYVKTDNLLYNKIDDLSMLCSDLTDVMVNIVEFDNTTNIVKQIKNSEVVDQVNLLESVGYGKYLLYFTDAEGNSVSAKYSAFYDKYAEKIVEYLPITPTITATINDKDYEVNVLSLKLNAKTYFKFATIETNAEVYYKLNQGEWVKASEIEIDPITVRNIQVKAVVDGVDSDIVSIGISQDKSFGGQEILSIIIIAIGGLVLFFVFIPVVRYFIRKPLNVSAKKKKDDEKEHL